MSARVAPLRLASSALWNQYQSWDHLRRVQAAALRRLLRHAYAHVPYYRRLFDSHAVDPCRIRGPEDLPLLPISTKDDIRTCHVEDVCARGARPEQLRCVTTSGSTSEPFTTRRTALEVLLTTPFGLRALRYYGLRPQDRRAEIICVRDPRLHNGTFVKRRLVYRHVQVDVRQPLERILEALRVWQPDVLGGHANTLHALAGMLTDEDRRLIRPRLITSGSEMLTAPMRERIAEAFGPVVYNMYGSQEFRLIAWECRETHELHVCDDAVVVEVVRDGQPVGRGESGEAIVTGLCSYAMPLIRFPLGDIVVKGSERCSCGLPFSTIGIVRGRTCDFFRLPSGRLLDPQALIAEAIATAKWIRQYQLIQDRRDQVVLRIMPFGEPSGSECARLRSALLPHLGPGVDLSVLLVREIRRSPAGKLCVAVSLVPRNGAGAPGTYGEDLPPPAMVWEETKR